jgi:hypothetical protein
MLYGVTISNVIDRLTDWLVGRLAGRYDDLSAGQSVGHVLVRLVGLSVNRLVD